MSSILFNEKRHQLPDIEADAWTRLTNGSANPRDAFRYGTLATQADFGIGLRTVVLRQTDFQAKTIFFHSDNRAGKIAEIQAVASVSCLFYDHNSRIQLRLSGRGFVHSEDTVSEEHWRQLPLSSRKSYLSQYKPASAIESPTDGLPENLQGRVLPSPEASETGRANFAVIRCDITFMDWLWLGENGHRRAQFFYANQQLEKMQWVTP